MINGWIDAYECLLYFAEITPSDRITSCTIDGATTTQLPIDKLDHQIILTINGGREIFYLNLWHDINFVYFILTEKNEQKYFLKEIDDKKRAIWSLSDFRGFITIHHAEAFVQKCQTQQKYSIRNVDVDSLC